MAQQSSSELGALLKRHRLAAGLTQEELAEAAGVSARSIGNLERGLQRTPYPATVRRLADALELQTEERTAFLAAAFWTPAGTAPTEAVTARGPSGELGSRYAALSHRWWPVAALAAAVLLVSAALLLASLPRAQHGATLGTLVRNFAVPRASTPARPTSLTVAPDGTTYVLDRAAASIRVYSPAGHLRASWGSAGSRPGQMWEPGGLALGPAHALYVADTGNNRIEKFSDSGRLLRVWSDQYGAPGTFRPVGVAVDGAGSVYVADSGHFRVLRLDSSGHLLDTVGHNFPPPLPVLSAICVGPTGKLYVGDAENNVVYLYGSGGLPTEAGGMPMATALTTASQPTSVAADRQGNVYVAYRDLGAVQELSPLGVVLHTWRGKGLRSPSGLARGPNGELYVADPGSGEVLRLASGRWVPMDPSAGAAGNEGIARRIAAGPNGSVALADDGTPRITWPFVGSGHPTEVLLSRSSSARFVGPIGGLAAAADGTVYATDYSGGGVVKVTPDGQIDGSWASSSPGMVRPEGVAVDRTGNVYVADEGNGRVQEFSSRGRLLNLLPIPQPSAGLVGLSPYGVAVDQAGNVYVSDEINDRIVKVDRNDRILFQWGNRGSGRTGLRAPQGIALDEKRGRLYVADNGNNRIQILSTTGTLLGAVPADRPQDIAVDAPGGHVFILDAGGTRVQVFAM